MARLLKNVYFKASSHSKLCSFTTKANPYVEVFKTLKSREQDLRNRNKSFPDDILSENTSTDQHLSGKSVSLYENKLLNAHDESMHMKEDSIVIKHSEDAIKKTGETICDNAFFSDKIFDSENSDLLEKFISVEQKFEDKDKNEFLERKKINDQSSNNFMTENQRHDIKEFIITFPHQMDTKNIRQSKDFKERPINKDIYDSESQKSKKKSKKSKAKTSHLDGNKSTGDLNSKDNKEIASPYRKSTEKTENENTSKKFSKTKSKSRTHFSVTKDDMRKKARQDNATQSLKSLIDAYINAKEINKAHRIFEILNLDKKKKEFVDVNLYNLIMYGWAREGRLDKVKQLFFQMNNDKIVPNLQSFASYLEAVSRSKCVDISEIPKIVNEMKSQGFSPKELLQKCIFIADQREKVIEALGFVERDLSVPLYVPEEAYPYKLLEKLNDKNYGKGENHFNFCFKAEDVSQFSSTQMETEYISTIKIKSVDTVTELTDKIINCREYLKKCEKMWRIRLTKVINNLKTPKKQNQGILGLSPNQSIYPYLAVIDTERLVNLLLQEARVLGETAEFYSPNIKVLYRELGSKVMRLYFMALNKQNNVTDKVHFIYEKYLSYLLDPDLYAKYSPREYWEFLKSKYTEGPTIDVSNVNWPYSLLVFIGSILYDVLRSNICFNPNCVNRKTESNFMYPAFHVVYENHDVKLNRQIRTHDMFSKLYRDAKLDYLEFDVSIVPMLSPPRPWIKYDAGGMLITKVPFIRFPEYARSQSALYLKVPTPQLNACFDSLNNLSLCPWIINKPILDIVVKIFQDGGSEELDIPLNPANFFMDTKSVEKLDENGKLSYKCKMEYEKKKCEMTSLWFDCLYKLSIANHFRDKVFWFPHNLDFRGRVYPTPPHFNHLGSDMSRSILLFAEGKPLGEKGLDWLKIHLINLTGFKKRAPHSERLEYANEMLPEILNSADNPFDGNKWWLKSDKPLQTLACCKEVANAVRHPNPKEYISHFPVHQDGSCNGLQHYAALGRDELGAIEVNLHPSNSPQDVYSGVAALVEKEREKDANNGLEIAEALKGFVTRKVVKQTVMTFVYGVTPYGARLQVLKQLKDMPEFPEKYQHAAATYLMKKIFLSIREMFTATKKIQDWFTECAEEITRVTEDAVEWVTPLGLPVVQPYYKETVVRSSKFCISKGNQENVDHYVSHFEPYQLPNIRKQKNAFAPNFIHSLDSTHMMLTSLFCHRKGVTFVSVHDCYWTHAFTVEIMNKICREQFVSLHNEPILENLSQYFVERYAANISEMSTVLNQKQIKAKSNMRAVLSAVPDKGTFDLKQVLNSEYFFS